MELNFILVGSKTTFLNLLTNTANLSVECLFLHLGDSVLMQGEKEIMEHRMALQQLLRSGVHHLSYFIGQSKNQG